MSEIKLSPEQQEALNKCNTWYASITDESFKDNYPIFRLFGYAGTGKTTATKAIVDELQLSDVCYAAYTGKAALVMQQSGTPAATIHSTIYKYVKPEKQAILELEDKIKKSTDEKEKKTLSAKLYEITQPHFELNHESPLRLADLFVLDECSMVDEELLNDIKTFKVPLLVLGDPGQLPPINGTGVLTDCEPDSMLLEIHRQAAENPIIQFATRARNGVPLQFGQFEHETGSAIQISKNALGRKGLEKFCSEYDQVICGKNATRMHLNKFIRGLHGKGSSLLPVKGDKLICLKNDKEADLFNGLMCEVVEVGELTDYAIELFIRTELMDEDDEPQRVRALTAYFDAYENPHALRDVPWFARQGKQEFDFGYAITVHKSQGSQWNNVLFYDDGFLKWDNKERRRWLYTGITRAAQRLTIVAT